MMTGLALLLTACLSSGVSLPQYDASSTAHFSNWRHALHTDQSYRHVFEAATQVNVHLIRKSSSSAAPAIYCRRDGFASETLYDVYTLLVVDGDTTVHLGGSLSSWHCILFGGLLSNSLWLPMDGTVENWAYLLSAMSFDCDAGYTGPGCSVALGESTMAWGDNTPLGIARMHADPISETSVASLLRIPRRVSNVSIEISNISGILPCISIVMARDTTPREFMIAPSDNDEGAEFGLIGRWTVCENNASIAVLPPEVVIAAGSRFFIGATALNASSASTGDSFMISISGQATYNRDASLFPFSSTFTLAASNAFTFAPSDDGATFYALGNASASPLVLESGDTPLAMCILSNSGGLDFSKSTYDSRSRSSRGDDATRFTNVHSLRLTSAASPYTVSSMFLTITLELCDVEFARRTNLTVVLSRGILPHGDPLVSRAWAERASTEAITLTLSAAEAVVQNDDDDASAAFHDPTGMFSTYPPISITPAMADNTALAKVTWEVPYPATDASGAPWLLAVSAVIDPSSPMLLWYSPSASLQPCSARCHGRCAYTSTSALSYWWCQCPAPERWAGVNCDVPTQSASQYSLELVALVGSNCVALTACFIALRARLWLEAAVFAGSGFSSAIYHSCDTGSWCADVGYAPLQALDFATAYLSVFVMSVRLAGVPDAVRHPLIVAVLSLLILLMFEPNNNLGITLDVAVPVTGVAVVGGIVWSAWCAIRRAGPRLTLRAAIRNRVYEIARGCIAFTEMLCFCSPFHVRQRGGAVAATDGAQHLLSDEQVAAASHMLSVAGEEYLLSGDQIIASHTPLDADFNNYVEPVSSSDFPQSAKAGMESTAAGSGVWLFALPCVVLIDLFFTKNNFRLAWFVGGLACFAVAFACKVLATNANYWELHSCWHMFVYSAAGMLVLSRRDHFVPLALAFCKAPPSAVAA